MIGSGDDLDGLALLGLKPHSWLNSDIRYPCEMGVWMSDLDQIEAELQLSRDALFEKLGRADGAVFATPEDQRERGRAFYENLLSSLRQDICRISAVKNFAGKGDHGIKVQAAAAAAIADLIGGNGAVTCAVLVVQAGLDQVCSNEWRTN